MEEIRIIEQKDLWTLTNIRPGLEVIDIHWVYQVKRNQYLHIKVQNEVGGRGVLQGATERVLSDICPGFQVHYPNLGVAVGAAESKEGGIGGLKVRFS